MTGGGNRVRRMKVDGTPEVGTTFYGYNAHTDVETVKSPVVV